MEEFLKKIGLGRRPINDPFFDESYKVCKVFQRKGITVEDEEELCHMPMKQFPCNVPGCKAIFETLLDFEMHYNSMHRYVCTECKKSRPNARLLEIHIQENHDSFFKILAERQPMFQCYVSECELKFNNPCERKEHCITVHKFPKNFRFDETIHHKDKGPVKDHMEIDPPKETQQQKTKKVVHNLSKNQKCKTFTAIPKSSTADSTNTAPANTQSDTPINSKSSLAFIPRQVQKSYSKLLTNNQNREKNVLETDNMMDLVESLPK